MTDRQAEARRIRRVSDMLTSAHSDAADRLGFWARAADIALLLGGFLITLLAFGVGPPALAKLLPWLGALVFMMGLVDLVLRPADLAARHRVASNSYAEVKIRAKQLAEGGVSQDELAALTLAYSEIPKLSIGISSRKFAKSKQAHLQKVAMSRLLDRFPFANLFVVTIFLRFRQTTRSIKAARKECGSPPV